MAPRGGGTIISSMPYISLLIAVLALLPPLNVGAAPAVPTPVPRVISQVRADLDGDGRVETLEVVLRQGRRVRDSEPWCGAGEKWEGRFALRVRRGQVLLDEQAWGELFYPHGGPGEAGFFWAPLNLVLADYNRDGRPDFNLGVYGSCNANLYRLFTLEPGGHLRELPLPGGHPLAVSGAGQSNSTPLIRMEDGLLTHSYYDNSEGKEITERYRWQDGIFVPASPSH